MTCGKAYASGYVVSGKAMSAYCRLMGHRKSSEVARDEVASETLHSRSVCMETRSLRFSSVYSVWPHKSGPKSVWGGGAQRTVFIEEQL